jgi:Rha family phage regulatory protein
MVAKQFGKRHGAVLRDIRKLMEESGKEFSLSNFKLEHDINELANGKPEPFYVMTFDGTFLLVMGYTGKSACKMKLEYLRMFNEMLVECCNLHSQA